MNAFESLVASLLEQEGYWVRTSFKVDLTKAEKRAIGKPSSPRWELDLVAYKPDCNDLRVIECKSYLDSKGVQARDFNEAGKFNARRYKLFNDRTLREVVLNRAVRQLVGSGMCRPEPQVVLCLAAGRICSDADESRLAALFTEQKWVLLTKKWILDGLRTMSRSGYENSAASIVAKLMEG